MKSNAFKKSSRLLTNSQFRAALSHKCFKTNELITLYTAVNDKGFPRFGVSLSKSIASAVVRNRLKRLGREAFRLCRGKIAENRDYLLIFSPRLSKKDKEELLKIGLDDVIKAFLELAPPI